MKLGHGPSMVLKIIIMAATIHSPVVFGDQIDDELISESREINKNAPTQVDKTTVLESSGYSNRVFFYHFKQSNHRSSDFNVAQKAKFASLLRTQVVAKACTGSALKPYINAGVKFKYVHFGTDNGQIAEATVEKMDCLKLK